jgi:hypothetical protein
MFEAAGAFFSACQSQPSHCPLYCGIGCPGFRLSVPSRIFAQQETDEHSAKQDDKQRYRTRLPESV